MGAHTQRMDKLTPERRSANMSRIRSKNTSVELALRKALWAEGLRGYRVHPSAVPGRPDIAWVGKTTKVAIFADGCFWHQCPEHFVMPSSNIAYWKPKLDRNRERDEKVNHTLTEDGWTVVRIWEHEVEGDLAGAVATVRTALSR